MNNQSHDWRADFRLHTLDLDAKPGTANPAEPHWMLRENHFVDMLAILKKDYLKLCSLGGNPFNGGEITPEGILAKLGFDKRPEPSGIFASGKFMASFVIACCRETNKVYDEMGRLRQAARPGRWFK